MATSITIRDENLAGQSFREWQLEVLTERLTVRELIRSRVYQEVQDYNRKLGPEFWGLIQPGAAERTPHGFRMEQPREIDWNAQFARAVEAFERGQIVLIVDDRQAETLAEQVELTHQSCVSFLRLMPLVGG